MSALWPVLLIVLGGLLAGGALSTWKTAKPLSVALAACAALAVAGGLLRLDYL
ncbi:hypothetical protein [Nocardiopsis ansamitocini]|uniref:Uncharacterized protein n=1 Tax=Nocardiopsis ansamitocini TaxID=1670832 RepID=A0A9W6P2J6_9ACTN|nr:hypothetical protein [Nocardiopsis ansamitocini]GLU45937.1 hypothetical protein Nans01_02880 [Nocardiopsis ansamitocini]